MTTETKAVQLKLPTFEQSVAEAKKKGLLMIKVPYEGRHRIILTKQPSRSK